MLILICVLPSEAPAADHVVPMSGEKPGEQRSFDVGDNHDIVLSWIPPGKVKYRIEDEAPLEAIITRGYWIAKTECTQAQWMAVMGDKLAFEPSGDDLPAFGIGWRAARGWCKTLTSRLRAAGKLAPEWRFDLPTEAQWELAATDPSPEPPTSRPGKESQASGSTFRSSPDGRDSATAAVRDSKEAGEERERVLSEMGWSSENSGGKPHPVAQKKPNARGIYDMHGNAFEWCRDSFDSEPASGVDPVGLPEGLGAANYVLRGGSWDYGALNVFSNGLTREFLAREWESIDAERPPSEGFRAVLVPEGDAAEVSEAGLRIPPDLQGCILELDKLMPDSFKKEVKELDGQLSWRVHMGLGMTLRNAWGLWAGSDLAKYFVAKGVYHPDNMSAIILDAWQKHLKGESVKEADFFKGE